MKLHRHNQRDVVIIAQLVRLLCSAEGRHCGVQVNSRKFVEGMKKYMEVEK